MNALLSSFTVRGPWVIVVGTDVEKSLQMDKLSRVPLVDHPPGCFESEPLCQWQADKHAQGYACCVLQPTIYGWSVRAQSGLDGFAILAGVRSGELDGSLDSAVRWARAWCAQFPARRHCVVHKDRLTQLEVETLIAC